MDPIGGGEANWFLILAAWHEFRVKLDLRLVVQE